MAMDKKRACPECGSPKLIKDYEKGELICGACGLVLTENIQDAGPEWRAFDAEQKEKRARGGAPIKYMRPNKGLVTEIDQYNRDIRGVKISTRKQAQFYRMRKWHKRVSIATSMERNLTIALAELDRVASYLGLPDDIKEAAALLYRKAVKAELIRGRIIESIVAAVIYAICRMHGIPRTLDEISKASAIEKKEIGRAYRFLKAELDLAVTAIEKKPAAGLHSVALAELPLVLLVEKSSRITAADQLWQRDKIEEPLLCLPAAEAIPKNFQQGLARLGVDWFPSMEVSSVDLIETYVANGFGIGVSVQVPGGRISPNVRAVPLPDFAPVILGALWRGKTSALVQAFLDELQLRAKRFA